MSQDSRTAAERVVGLEARERTGVPGGGVALELPVIAPGTQLYTCSRLCKGACCKYFSLEIDTPRSASDFDALRWYLMHEDTHVYKYEGAWFLQVQRRCRNLLPNNLCGAYEKRPEICSDYDPSDCEYTGEVPFDLYFRDDAELETWLSARLLARKEAARKGAARRRAMPSRARAAKSTGRKRLRAKARSSRR